MCKCERKLVSCPSGEEIIIKSGHTIHIIDLKMEVTFKLNPLDNSVLKLLN